MDNKQHIIECTNKTRDNFIHVMASLGINPDKTILVHPYILINDDSYLPLMIEYVIEQLNMKGWDCKIVFYHPSEGFCITQMRFYSNIVKHLITNYSFPKCNFMYVTGAAKTKDNLVLYHKYCTEFDMILGILIHSAVFESNYNLDKTLLKKEHNLQKKFVCLNGVSRPHRLAIISEIVRRNLKDQCFLSLVLKDYEIPIDYNAVKLFFSEGYADLIKKHTEFLSVPLNLTLKADDSNMHIPNNNDIKLHNNSLFSLVNETIFFNDPKYYCNSKYHDNMMCYPGTFFTEKTWKCVNLKHPFILCTTPHALLGFKELGYKTFHPYINEKYDTIKNETDRISAIMDEVERLCNMNESETKIWLEKVSEICEYNYQVLASKPALKIAFAE